MPFLRTSEETNAETDILLSYRLSPDLFFTCIEAPISKVKGKGHPKRQTKEIKGGFCQETANGGKNGGRRWSLVFKALNIINGHMTIQKDRGLYKGTVSISVALVFISHVGQTKGN